MTGSPTVVREDIQIRGSIAFFKKIFLGMSMDVVKLFKEEKSSFALSIVN